VGAHRPETAARRPVDGPATRRRRCRWPARKCGRVAGRPNPDRDSAGPDTAGPESQAGLRHRSRPAGSGGRTPEPGPRRPAARSRSVGPDSASERRRLRTPPGPSPWPGGWQDRVAAGRRERLASRSPRAMHRERAGRTHHSAGRRPDLRSLVGHRVEPRPPGFRSPPGQRAGTPQTSHRRPAGPYRTPESPQTPLPGLIWGGSLVRVLPQVVWGGSLVRVLPQVVWGGSLVRVLPQVVWGGSPVTARPRVARTRTPGTGPTTPGRRAPAGVRRVARPESHLAPGRPGLRRATRRTGGRRCPRRWGLMPWAAGPTVRIANPVPRRSRLPEPNRVVAAPFPVGAEGLRLPNPARGPSPRTGRADDRNRIGAAGTPGRRSDAGVARPRAAGRTAPDPQVVGIRRWDRAATGRRRPVPRTATHRSEWTAAVERTRSAGRRSRRMRRSPVENGRPGTAELGRPTWPRPAARRRTAPRTSYAPPPSGSAGPAVDSAVAAAPECSGPRPAVTARPSRGGDRPTVPGAAATRHPRCPTQNPAPPPSILDLWLEQIGW
jgi:hypothetical protein